MIEHKVIQEGLAKGEFFLEYQPVCSLKTNRCVGAEALSRWRRGSTVLLPDAFLPSIENTPLSGLLTYWVIETVGRELGSWLRAQAGVHVSINVPPEILGRGGVAYAGTRAGLMDVAHKIVLEISEKGIPDKLGLQALSNAARYGDEDEPPQWLRALSALLRATPLQVIAEGVESKVQVEKLKAAGIELIQGLYFSPPLVAKDFEEFARAHRQ
jgi:sensor c-di-GMP phosphodiesterase-like protein